MLHYHGKNDLLLPPVSVLRAIDAFWVKRGFKGFIIEMEDGMGHMKTKKSLKRMNEFIHF